MSNVSKVSNQTLITHVSYLFVNTVDVESYSFLVQSH